MRSFQLFIVVSVLMLFSAPACKDGAEPSCYSIVENLEVNRFQFIGSHNSYRLRTFEPMLQFLYANAQNLPGGFQPDDWDYTHVPLEEQLNNYGIRSIELDVFNDPNGGLFYYRMGNAFLGLDPASGEPALLEPGLKILHFPDIDYLTNYLTFKSALTTLKNWSDAHPDHLPVVVLVEPKEDDPYSLLGPPFTSTIAFNKSSLESIDDEIKGVFGGNLFGVLTPDEVRGEYSTLNEAILQGNWPALEDTRGQVIFVMIPSGNEGANYLDGHASLAGRTMFMFSEPGQPETAFLSYEDPRGVELEIQSRVMEGYFVRTRADADTKEARSGDVSRRNAAFNSGAQIISTDYYRPDPRGGLSAGWTNYSVQLPSGALALINPVNGDRRGDLCPIEE